MRRLHCKGWLIPADINIEPRVVRIWNDSPEQVSAAIFDGYKHGPVGMSSMRGLGLQFAYDDLGLLNGSQNNERAMALMERLTGSLTSPLAGNWLVLGLDPVTGETEDVPEMLVKMLPALEASRV